MKKTVAIVGAGVNGVSLAAVALGELGHHVTLIDKDVQWTPFAETSSKSSKLLHVARIRYLEHFHFGLVREALSERACFRLKASNYRIESVHDAAPVLHADLSRNAALSVAALCRRKALSDARGPKESRQRFSAYRPIA